jgi:hypothetical protein
MTAPRSGTKKTNRHQADAEVASFLVISTQAMVPTVTSRLRTGNT